MSRASTLVLIFAGVGAVGASLVVVHSLGKVAAAMKTATAATAKPNLVSQLVAFWNVKLAPVVRTKENTTQWKAFEADRAKAVAALGKMKTAEASPSEFLGYKALANGWASRVGVVQFS